MRKFKLYRIFFLIKKKRKWERYIITVSSKLFGPFNNTIRQFKIYLCILIFELGVKEIGRTLDHVVVFVRNN